MPIHHDEVWAGLTPEDADILAASLEMPSRLLESDDTDYRAMLAREQDKRETYSRGESYGYDSAVINDVDIERRDAAILKGE